MRSLLRTKACRTIFMNQKATWAWDFEIWDFSLFSGTSNMLIEYPSICSDVHFYQCSEINRTFWLYIAGAVEVITFSPLHWCGVKVVVWFTHFGNFAAKIRRWGKGWSLSFVLEHISFRYLCLNNDYLDTQLIRLFLVQPFTFWVPFNVFVANGCNPKHL